MTLWSTVDRFKATGSVPRKYRDPLKDKRHSPRVLEDLKHQIRDAPPLEGTKITTVEDLDILQDVVKLWSAANYFMDEYLWQQAFLVKQKAKVVPKRMQKLL